MIETRITDWKIKLCDTIADNASGAGRVLGEARVSRKDMDVQLPSPSMPCLTNNGATLAEGRRDAVRKVESFGVRLKAGDLGHGGDIRAQLSEPVR